MRTLVLTRGLMRPNIKASAALTWTPLCFTLHLFLLPPRHNPSVHLVHQPHDQHEQSCYTGQRHRGDGQVLEVLVQHLCRPQYNTSIVDDVAPYQITVTHRSL